MKFGIMSTKRLKAFSDGVFAIIITIMVLEFEIPHGHDLAALRPLLPVVLSYILSFILVANYWNNHHHTFHIATEVNGRILWANAHLLFWLSLTPIATIWMGENISYPLPIAVFGVLQLACAIAYFILSRALVYHHGPESEIAKAVGAGKKERISLAIYLISVPLAFLDSRIAFALYFIVAAMWIVPDRRIAKRIGTPTAN
jgi:uncharacterized membrane protein